MRFALSDEQQQLGSAVAALLGDANTPHVARAWASGDHAPGLALWRRLADLGVTALTIPSEYDGLGAGPVEVVVAFEQLGRQVVPGPLIESVAVTPALLSGDPAGRWLPGIAAGRTVATLAAPPVTPYALDADVAHPVLVLDGGVLRQGRSGAAVSSVDRARRLFQVVPGEPVGADAGRALDAGVLACAAYLLGTGRALLDMTVEYARQRRQFGREIGSFQAVKHQLADVLVGLELARPLAFGAAVTGSVQDISAARVAAGDAAYRAFRVALQVHGAIGYTAEHDLSLWLTKVRALLSAWGTRRYHQARILEAAPC